MAARPTRGCCGVAVAAAGTALVGRVVGDPWVYASGGALAGLILTAYVLTGRLRGATVDVALPVAPRVGVATGAVVTVRSRRRLAASVLLEHPGWPAARADLRPDGGPVDVAVVPSARGSWHGAGRLVLTTGSPLGMFRRRLVVPLTGEVVVRPREARAVPLPTPVGSREGGAAVRRGAGFEVRGPRAWQPGDGAGAVHARLSARHGRLISLDRETHEASGRLVVAVDGAGLGRGAAAEDALARAAATADAAIRSGREVVLTDGSDFLLQPSRSEVLDWFARLDPAPAPQTRLASVATSRAGAGGVVLWVSPTPFPASARDQLRHRGGAPVLLPPTIEVAEPQARRKSRARVVPVPVAGLGPARWTAALAGVAAQATAAHVRVLPPLVLAAGIPAVLAATAVGARLAAASVRVAARTRSGARLAALLFSAATVLRVVGHPGALPAIHALAVLLVGIQAAGAVTMVTARDVRSSLGVTGTLLLAAAAVTSNGLAGLPLIGTWGVVVATLVQLHRSTSGATASGRRDGIVAVTAVAVIAGLACSLVLPAGVGSGLRHRLAHGDGDPAGDAQAAGDFAVGAGGSGTMPLNVRGTLGQTPELIVPGGSPPLWRSTVYRTYDGTQWSASNDPLAPATFARLPGSGTFPEHIITVPAAASDPLPTGGVTRTDIATFPSRRSGVTVSAPGVLTQIGGLRSAFVSDAGVDANADGASGYVVTSTVAPTDSAVLSAAVGPDDVDPVWTSLPAELPASVRDLARSVTAGVSNRYAQVGALETWLRTHATYRQDSPLPGQGDDAVADFLFRDHTGFCEQFASAEAVLLRTLGVPARVVSGLAYGQDEPDGTRLLRDSDSHAWVEVYYPGVGWSPTDPTAGVPLAVTTPSTWNRLRHWMDHLVAHPPGGRLVTAAGLAVLAIAVLQLARVLRRIRRRPGRRAARRAAPQGPVLTAYQRLATRPGPGGRGPDETPREHVGRLRDPDLAAALAVLEQECYGAAAPPPADVDRAVATFTTTP